MPQYQIRLAVADPDRAEYLADLLEAVLGEEGMVTWFEVEEGFDIDDGPGSELGFAASDGIWAVEGFIDHDDPEALQAELEIAFEDEPDISLSVQAVEDKDWVALSLAGLKPVTAGRFVVHGAHDRGHLPIGAIPLEIEANQAFGTGHHPTTEGCLIALTDLCAKQTFRSVLDLGCGSGVLALGYVKLTKRAALASDIDPVAVRIAQENIRRNGAASHVHVVTATGFGHAVVRNHRYDLILANILAGPLMDLAPEMARHIVHGGKVILSGLLAAQARAVDGAFRAAGFYRERKITIGDWCTLVMRC